MNTELLRLIVWRNALGAVQMRYGQGPQLPSLSAARRLVKQSMGPRARIWKSAEGFTLGYDQHPGRTVLARGKSLHACLITFMGTLLPEPQAEAKPQSDPAPEQPEQHQEQSGDSQIEHDASP